MPIPMKHTTGDGVETGVLRQSHGEMHRDDAVAATIRNIIAFIVA